MFVFRQSLWLQFCNGLKGDKGRKVEARADGACISIQERSTGALEQGENSGGGGKMFDSAYALKVEPPGLVKDCKMFSVRGQTVNMLGFAGHTLLQLLNSAVET